ncbi:MAG: LysR family transcriptional regulator [Hyphomicrobiales bacterium]|nr:MAG: LysR family transcriptional regulator [Hyphomicrobiales bacterium]
MRVEMNMRHIEVFRAVMISGSVVGAAKLLNVTQPGVSRTIALLEMRLGYELFQRKGRRLAPTSEAEALYREVEQLYVGIDRITQVAYDIRHHRAGALRLATLPALGQWVVPSVITRFLATRPHVKIFVQTLPSTQIAELVATQQFDLGVVELPMSKSGVIVHPLPPARIVAVLPAGHRLAEHEEVALSDLGNERLILPSPQSYLRYQIDDALNQQSISAQVVAETPTSPLICGLVAEGAGVGLVSSWTPLPHGDPRIVQRPLKELLYSKYACLRPEAAVSMALADEFQTLLAEAMTVASSV